MSIPLQSCFESATADTIVFYIDGSCMSNSNGPIAGYSVYVDHTMYKASICEPLPGILQTSQRAELKALSVALELICALRIRHGIIISDSEYTTNAYNSWRHNWKKNDWTRSNGQQPAHLDLWKIIDLSCSTFKLRGITVGVQWAPRNTSPGQRVADQLAKQACALQKSCPDCKLWIGRKGFIHVCRPTCSDDQCDGRAFGDVKAYLSHCRDVHSTQRPCRRSDCHRVCGSEEAALSHERSVHYGYVYECDYCDSFFDCQDDVDDHECNECQYAPYCGSCCRWFVNLRARNQHSRDFHGMY